MLVYPTYSTPAAEEKSSAPLMVEILRCPENSIITTMAKKKNNSANAAKALESMVAPILEINYSDPLFTVAAHPSRPILFSGLATGHVYCNTYNGSELEEAQQQQREKWSLLEKEAFSRGKIAEITKSVSQLKQKWWTVVDNLEETDAIKTNWKTKRHQGSVRHAIFDPLVGSVGENIYTVGTDHIIKKASIELGKVIGKVNILEDYKKNDSVTKMCHSTTLPFLLAGTESGSVLIYDSKNLGANPALKFKVEKAHDDAVNHILAMPAVSAYHYLTLGSTTLAHIDIRKGIITQSDNQDDELMAMSFPTDHVNENKNDTVLVAHGEGIVTIWKQLKNMLMDQLSRIKVNKGVSIDAIVPTMNADTDDLTNSVWCGDSEGLLHRINYKKGKVVETRVHSPIFSKKDMPDEVGLLEIDYEYRLISAGMDTLKIWSNAEPKEEDDGDDFEDDIGDLSDSDIDAGEGEDGSEIGSDSDSHSLGPSDFGDSEPENSEDEEEAEEEKPQIIRRERKDISQLLSKPKRRVIDISKITKANNPVEEPQAEPTKKKQKVKQMSTKQLRNMQKHEHGIKRFDDL